MSYYWINSNTRQDYAILRVYTEGQIHLDEFASMLQAFLGAYRPLAQVEEWYRAAKLRDREFVPFDERRYRQFKERFEHRYPFPIREDLASAFLAAYALRPPVGSLVDEIRVQPIDAKNQLILDRCTLGSPGNLDLLGLGSIVKAVFTFINQCLDRKACQAKTAAVTNSIEAKARKTRAEAHAQEAENRKAVLEQLERVEGLARDLGYSVAERRHLLEQYLQEGLLALGPHIESGAIEHVEVMQVEERL